MGSIFSILRAPNPGADADPGDYLQPGSEQVAAGYAIYGPSTMLVLTVGRGVVGFTLDPELGDFLLTHPDIRIPDSSCEFAINSSNSRFWEGPVKRYVEECLAGQTGPRGKDFNMRWVASLVAEAHRILMRGGVFLYPRDTEGSEQGRSPPTALRGESHRHDHGAGRRTGEHGRGAGARRGAVTSLHQRIGFVFGSAAEVERIEQYHTENSPEAERDETPLFKRRGLFRDPN